MVELTRQTFIPFLLEDIGYGLVVGKDEVVRFQNMAEMLYGFVDD
jgi:hypothetical protein